MPLIARPVPAGEGRAARGSSTEPCPRALRRGAPWKIPGLLPCPVERAGAGFRGIDFSQRRAKFAKARLARIAPIPSSAERSARVCKINLNGSKSPRKQCSNLKIRAFFQDPVSGSCIYRDHGSADTISRQDPAKPTPMAPIHLATLRQFEDPHSFSRSCIRILKNHADLQIAV